MTTCTRLIHDQKKKIKQQNKKHTKMFWEWEVATDSQPTIRPTCSSYLMEINEFSLKE